ncbi:MAG: trypsin-like peptidase domain-containing protein [Alphaproteobacteria bacterium]|nr:trypsin-like peptidase domain-containing protein [Alphaproteobacteria bacterium]MBU1524983.1 trypsin-like peptidase domain-containing protein [Alphaproteobacteria bacterium]MBU2116329.1 trypsin-like peptidase domain-containing protein [Alphaproteobacteria bacterium]MBU2349856.1 trypsin-like peptidase domain-containing protein [Alphaproteobacteria bacterium]MBU2382487.1 trypsin-like peptidase domain-containing protein [Alphaproteobacteria bacterium]
MLKRKEFILGAAAGLLVAAAATAGGFVRWPGDDGLRLTPSSGVAGAPFAQPPGAPASFAAIFDQVAPAVVQIDVRTRIPRRRNYQIPGLPFEFRPDARPDGQTPEGEGEDEGQLAAGAGSGFFISPDGYIVTNNHVVENAEEIIVRLADNRELRARLVGRDESTDLAVIKVEGERFAYVSFEDSAEPRVGDWVIAVGNPFGLGGTATAGIVSAKSRDLRDQSSSAYVDYIQIDAAINTGNSGGPTFDVHGRVIGVNTAIYSPTGASVGIGFAIPADTAKTITGRLMRGEQIERGYLGVEIADLDPFREALGLPEGMQGALINGVTAGGPAQRGGLQPGDIVVSLDGRPVADSTDLTRRVGAARVGQALRLEVLRAGGRSTLTVRAARRPPETELNAARPDEGAGPDAPASPGVEAAGLILSPMTAQQRARYSIPAGVNGVVVTGVAQGGDRRFTPGMVIKRVGTAEARTVDQVAAEARRARSAGRDAIFLLVWTGAGDVSVAMDLPRER